MKALINMDADPSTGFAKLNFLIANPPCPPESFGNLLLLYCKYSCFALAADIMAEYTHLHESALSQVCGAVWTWTTHICETVIN